MSHLQAPSGADLRPRLPSGGWPAVDIIDETMREGMQIERVSIRQADKLRLLNALSETGIRKIVVGSFVSPKWVPQMRHMDELVRSFEPRPGIEYRALTLNPRGAERRSSFVPPLTEPAGAERHATRVHVSDVFVRRNTNRGQDEEIARWPAVVQRAVEEGADAASIGLNASWGCNWEGPFDHGQRLDLLERQAALWEEAKIPIVRLWLGDPMGWNVPTDVRHTVLDVLERWPSITTVHLHLHDQRGMALLSAYAMLEALDARHSLVIDTTLGGIGGCPYCANGRATGMIPTEDFVHLLHELGIETGIDLDAVLRAGLVAEEVVGRRLRSQVTNAGPLPGPDRRYAENLPLIESFEGATHWRSWLTEGTATS